MPVVEMNGSRIVVARAFGTTRACACCGVEFVVTSITGRQSYCGVRCKERAQWRREALRPDVVATNRQRCAAWAVQHRAVRRRNPWLHGAPPFGEYLPGGAFSLRVTPYPKWPIALRNTRALHGLVTGLIGEPHDPTSPGFVLIPATQSPLGWGVYLPDQAAALRLAGKQAQGVLFDREVLVTCGPMHRIKAPRVSKRGHRTLRIDAITPVCIRNDGSRTTHVSPSGSNLCSTMAAWLPRRLGTTIAEDAIQLKFIERHTIAEWTDMGGKYGHVGGFVGNLIVDTNAVGEWLLRCAETVGLGGKSAFGFGRIRVTSVA